MAEAADQPSAPRQRRQGLPRGSLTPDLIVAESLRLLDKGKDGFSLSKLGQALGADTTAVYRHFTSKDDLVLAIADYLIEEAMADWSPRACWVEVITDAVRRLRRTYRAHPAAAVLSFCRATQRPAEMRIVDVLIEAVLDAGFTGAEAARTYRAIGDFALFFSGGEAAFLALDEGQQEKDEAAWTRTYPAINRNEYPHIWQIREELSAVQDDHVFEAILSLVISGLVRRAPRPCRCGAHAPDLDATYT